MFCMLKKEKIYLTYVSKHTYISKHNSNLEKQVILLIIPNKEKRHYLAVKKLSELLTGIISKHYGNFYCLNCLQCFPTENKT